MSHSTSSSSARAPRRAPQRQTIRTWAFDSVGDRKYALQLQKASNGNPCLRIVSGSPQSDGTYRKFDITVWSEDFPALFEHLEAMIAYVRANDIRTPADHNWKPKDKR